MKLHAHPDFEQAVLRAAEHFRARGLRPAIIEKDYYVTEVLRIIAAAAADKIIFKGGTSLSKGWNLIQRFSEDIDIFLDPAGFEPPLGKNAIDRELKKLRDAIRRWPALKFLEKDSRTIGGFGRSDHFEYTSRFGGPGEVASRVLIETGSASGREPTTVLELQSYLSQFLKETKTSLGADDETGFQLRLLHFRRTFVEKMFAIHSKVELLKRDGQPLGSYARHYYDLYQLAAQDDVMAMLKSPEYVAIKADYDRISRASFPKSYFSPDGMSFAKSDALFPSAELAAILGPAYEQQCSLLCYGDFPTWAEVLARLEELKHLL
ncbi:MAG: nucleotidyl transferase AbiEii/AbiGii toxin family protein [Tepidisphaeraceae bacterium]|jgi:predicted nucleotidyltransferase component of viral defense system